MDVSSNAAHIANVNPFRYRGYFYDTDTGFYYLQSRYYDPVVGRFLNADDFAVLKAAKQAVDCNVYSYCTNNPVNLIDMNGYFALTFTAVLSIAVIAVVACALALWYVNTPSFQRDWERMCRNIAGAFTGAISWASAQAKALAQSIGDSFARARSKPKYRTPREDHHIVAQMAYNASLARSVLRTVGIGINSRENRVLIKTGLHRRLHTNTYYGFANAVVISAYNKGSGNYQKRFNVLNALKTLKGMILAMDAIAPY